MPQLWKSAKPSVAFGSFFLMRIPTAAWKSLAKALGFSTFTTGPATIHQHETNFHLKNYKGWREAPGWCWSTNSFIDQHHPSLYSGFALSGSPCGGFASAFPSSAEEGTFA